MTLRASSGSPGMCATDCSRGPQLGGEIEPEEGGELAVAVLLDHVDPLVPLDERVDLARRRDRPRTRR